MRIVRDAEQGDVKIKFDGKIYLTTIIAAFLIKVPFFGRRTYVTFIVIIIIINACNNGYEDNLR